MVDMPKPEELKTITTSAENQGPSTLAAKDIVVEHSAEGDKASVALDPLSEMRSRMEANEVEIRREREARMAAERERDTAVSRANTATTARATSEAEKIVAQEAAIKNRVDAAKAEVENAERALEEAIDTGKNAKEQIKLQTDLAQAVYRQAGAESAKEHFDRWKANQARRPTAQANTGDGVTPRAQEWINKHKEQWEGNRRFRRTAEGAHMEYERTGKPMDTPEYFKYIEEALSEEGLLGGEGQSAAAPAARARSNASTAAPATHSAAAAGADGGAAASSERSGRRVVKLSPEMRDMAHRTYGKNTKFNLSNDDAERKYAQRQLEIQEKRKNGERI